mgnify:FL=1
MQKLTLKLDCSVLYDEDLNKYLTSLKGVNLVKIDKNNFDIYIEYNSNIISLKILKYEILYCLNLLRIPSIIGFDKHSTCMISKKKIVIKDLCCEYCLKGMMEDLLEIEGITSAYTDFDYTNKKGVNIYITYDENLITNNSLEEIERKFNNK